MEHNIFKEQHYFGPEKRCSVSRHIKRRSEATTLFAAINKYHNHWNPKKNKERAFSATDYNANSNFQKLFARKSLFLFINANDMN